MSSPCRVLVLNERDPHHPKAGGAEIHVAEIFRRLAARGYDRLTEPAARAGLDSDRSALTCQRGLHYPYLATSGDGQGIVREQDLR